MSKEDPTPVGSSASNQEKKMSLETVRCPDQGRYEGDLLGCGTLLSQEHDEEGWFDCPNCGLAFSQEGLKPMTKEEADAN